MKGLLPTGLPCLVYHMLFDPLILSALVCFNLVLFPPMSCDASGSQIEATHVTAVGNTQP